MIIFRLFSLLVFAGSAFSAGDQLLPFEDDVRVLHYVHDGRVFQAQRVNPEIPTHYEAAQILDPESQSDSQSSASSLLPNFSQWWRDQGGLEQAKLIESINAVFPFSFPLSQYILFLGSDLVGTFGLGIPDGFAQEMNLEGMHKAMKKAFRKDNNLSDSALEGINESNDGDDMEKTNLFPYHAVVTRYVLKKYRGKGIGFVMSSMIHQLIDSTRGKSMLVPHFNEEDGKFSTVWTAVPLMGCQSDIFASNIASLVSHLRFPNDANAPEDVEFTEDNNGNIKLIYPKTSGASGEMCYLKARIQAAKKEYKRS